MFVAENWKDYTLLDAADGERLEKWGDHILIRPDPQIIWNTEKKNPLWDNAHARYIRSDKGGGRWQVYKKLPDRWNIAYRNLSFNVRTMGFKHTGVFNFVMRMIASLCAPETLEPHILLAVEVFYFGVFFSDVSCERAVYCRICALNVSACLFKMHVHGVGGDHTAYGKGNGSSIGDQ